MTKRITAIAINAIAIALISLLLFLAGTWWRMNEQFRQGEAAFQRGDFIAAVAGYESAIHMYIPLHPTVEQAAQRLWTLGEGSERLGDISRALVAYRALRSSWYADRWLVTPGQEWINRCDQKIAALVALQKER